MMSDLLRQGLDSRRRGVIWTKFYPTHAPYGGVMVNQTLE